MLVSILDQHLRPGDRIVVGQATGEPIALVAKLIEAAEGIGGLKVSCGYSLNPAWKIERPDALYITTYCGSGTMVPTVARFRARVIPCAMSQLSAALVSRKTPVDVVLLQVSQADADGFHSLGPAVDYVREAAQLARVVFAEVSDLVPATRCTCRLHQSEVVVGLRRDAPLPEVPREPMGDVQLRVACEVAKLMRRRRNDPAWHWKARRCCGPSAQRLSGAARAVRYGG